MSLTYQEQQDRMAAFCADHLTEHAMIPDVSRAWYFGKPGSSHYSFRLIYAPCSFVLAGDLGELTLTHWNAISSNLLHSLGWLASSNFDYLMSKSDQKKVYDAEATADFIWSCLIDAASDHLIAYHRAIRAWRRRGGKPEDRPVRPLEVDDPFQRLAKALGESPAMHAIDRPLSAQRRELRDKIEGWIESDQDGGNLTLALLGDWDVSYSWPSGCLIQIAAMQWAAREIIAAEFSTQEEDAA